MDSIRLKEIIETCDIPDIAEKLFPGNKFPDLALKRILNGKAFLDTNQVSILSLMTGLSIEELYSNAKWKTKTEEGIHRFSNGEYTAELDTNTWITKLYHKGSIFHESVLHNGSVPLSEYLSNLTSLISKYIQDESIKN